MQCPCCCGRVIEMSVAYSDGGARKDDPPFAGIRQERLTMSKRKFAVLLGAAIAVALALIAAIVLLVVRPFDSKESTLKGFTLNNAAGTGVYTPPADEPEEEPEDSANALAYQLYTSALSSMPDAMEYAMFDILPDGIPELIVRRGTDESNCRFDCYSVMNNRLVHMNADGITAASCQLYGKDGQLFTVYQDAALFVIEVGDDMVLTQKLTDESLEFLMDTYTDSVVFCPADDDGLLDLLLMGGTYEGLNGWIRYKGYEYFYLNGELMKNYWAEKGESELRYLNGNGITSLSITYQEINQLVDEYYGSYLSAINYQDISYLVRSSESNTKIMKERIKSDENRACYYQLTGGSVYVAEKDNEKGHLNINARMELDTYSRQTGKYMRSIVLYYTFEIAYDSGEWLVDRVGYPSASDFESGRIA